MKPHGSVGSVYEIRSQQDDSRHKASKENHCDNESTWPPWPLCAKSELSFLGWQTPGVSWDPVWKMPWWTKYKVDVYTNSPDTFLVS